MDWKIEHIVVPVADVDRAEDFYAERAGFNLDVAQAQLRAAGIDCGDVFHFDAGSQTDGPDPGRADYGTFLSFSDPDGNGWLIQEVPSRPS
ncbi:MAG TPA: hypothetical protein VG244_13410 [Acidimicrobiales bacterium]|nr:hypothetical protein [Acidimicrobiales bacterium]